MSFNHGSCSSQHELNYRSNKRWNNLIWSIWYNGLYSTLKESQTRFPAWFSSPHSTLFIRFMSGTCDGQWVWDWPLMIGFLKPHENYEWSGLVGTGLLHCDKAVLQISTWYSSDVLILKAVYMLLYAMKYSSTFMEDLTSTMNTHTHSLHLEVKCTENCNSLLVVRKLIKLLICWVKRKFVTEYNSIPLVIYTAICKC
jgi:hypothetical protein